METRAHFLRLFQYERWANERIFAAAKPHFDPEAAGYDERIVTLMSHILLAGEVWLMRLRVGAAPNPWQRLSANDAEARIHQLYTAWQAEVNSATDAFFGKKIAYTNLKGEPFETPVMDILTHVVNHGTYHRAQIAARLKEIGTPPPPTDFIVFSRE